MMKRIATSTGSLTSTRVGSSTKRAKHGPDEEGGNWSLDTHRAFVEAILLQGMTQASPAVLQKEMTLNTETVTTERIKSRLQKYRKLKGKSIVEFMDEYDEWLKWAATLTHAVRPGQGDLLSTILPVMGTHHLLGGQAAAFLTYAAMSEEKRASKESFPEASAASRIRGEKSTEPVNSILAKGVDLNSLHEMMGHRNGVIRIPFPELSNDEKESSLGKAMMHVMGVMVALTQQRVENLNRKKEDKKHHVSRVSDETGSNAPTTAAGWSVQRQGPVLPVSSSKVCQHPERDSSSTIHGFFYPIPGRPNDQLSVPTRRRDEIYFPGRTYDQSSVPEKRYDQISFPGKRYDYLWVGKPALQRPVSMANIEPLEADTWEGTGDDCGSLDGAYQNSGDNSW